MTFDGPLSETNLNSDTLVVLLHGAFKAQPSSALRLSDVQSVVKSSLGNPDILAPALPCHAFSFVNPTLWAWDVIEAIDARWRQHNDLGKPLEDVFLIGYSF